MAKRQASKAAAAAPHAAAAKRAEAAPQQPAGLGALARAAQAPLDLGVK